MAKQISELNLKKYFTGELKHAGYSDTCKLSENMRIHIDGLYPKEMIERRRPSESDTIKKYRQEIFQPITQSTMGKVLTELMKIRKSEEWSINYNKELPASIKEGETPEDYFEKKYPFFTSVTNWLFNVMLKQMVTDPNSVCLVMPLKLEVPDNGFFEPYALIFTSEQVIDYEDNDYCILKSPNKSVYYTGTDKKIQKEGEIFYVITTTELVRYEQTADDTYDAKGKWNHQLGKLPAFKLGGKYKKVYEKSFVYESRLAVMLPRLNKALNEDNDLDAEVVQHIHSEAAIYQNQECKKCSGTGKTIVEGTDGPVEKVCPHCDGGYVNTSPYGNMIVRPGMKGEEAVPWPPKIYIQKDTAIVKIQDERVGAHEYKALAAINMEFLAQIPLQNSGVAKAYDTDGLNTFVNSVAEDLVSVGDRIYDLGVSIRYHFVEKQIRETLKPKIAVPEHFDYINANLMIEKMTSARNAKVHPVIITAMEIEYANAEFNNDPEVRDELKAIYSLDPFPGVSADERAAMLSNDLISREDAIVSANIQQYIKRAIRETANSAKPFLVQEYEEQMITLRKYAQGQIAAASAAQKVKDDLNADPEKKLGN